MNLEAIRISYKRYLDIVKTTRLQRKVCDYIYGNLTSEGCVRLTRSEISIGTSLPYESIKAIQATLKDKGLISVIPGVGAKNPSVFMPGDPIIHHSKHGEFKSVPGNKTLKQLNRGKKYKKIKANGQTTTLHHRDIVTIEKFCDVFSSVLHGIYLDPHLWTLSTRDRSNILELVKTYDYDLIETGLKCVKASDFLSNRVIPYEHWRCSLTWIVQPKNFAKILSGKYANYEKKSSHTDLINKKQKAVKSKPIRLPKTKKMFSQDKYSPQNAQKEIKKVVDYINRPSATTLVPPALPPNIPTLEEIQESIFNTGHFNL